MTQHIKIRLTKKNYPYEIATTILTLSVLIFCIYLSRQNYWWTALSILFFAIYVIALSFSFSKKNILIFTSIEDLYDWCKKEL